MWSEGCVATNDPNRIEWHTERIGDDLRKGGSGRMHMHVDKTGTRHVVIMALGDSSTWLVCHALECDRCIQKNDDVVRDVMREGRREVEQGVNALIAQHAGSELDLFKLTSDITKMAKKKIQKER